MVLSKKAVQFVSGGIISSYITTHYLEESKHLGVFKQSNLTFIDEFLKFDFADFTKLQEVFVAFTKDRKRLVSISDKILRSNGANKK